MSLIIKSPAVESRLRTEAAKQGIPAADYALQILSSHLGKPAESAIGGSPFHASATAEEWVAELNRWIGCHPSRKPIPDSALERETIYDGRY